MKTTIVIPSYWGRSWKEPIDPVDDVYDHPTPIDEEGTLKRALESFQQVQNRNFRIVIVGAATNPQFQESCQTKIEDIIENSQLKIPINLFSYKEGEVVKRNLEEKGYSNLLHFISFKGYSNIRNACIIAAILTDADIAVFFDDDEIIADPEFINKAHDFMGEEVNGKKVVGKAGYYIRPEADTYKIPPQHDWIWAEWDGTAAMNEAFRIIESTPRLKLTPFAFGGNMVIHSDLFTKVAFDPNIRRGEDIDYLFNAKMFGYDFLLDNELFIKHLPPKGRNPSWQGFRENIFRFVYSRQKLIAQKPMKGMRIVEAEELDPYPGVFLKDDLHDRIYKTSVLLALDYLSKKDEEGFKKALENIGIAKYEAKPEYNPFEWYLNYNQEWRELAAVLSSSPCFRLFD